MPQTAAHSICGSRISEPSETAPAPAPIRLLKELRVLFNKAVPPGRHVGFGENCRHRARRYTRIAIGAGCGVYITLLLIGATLNAVNGTHIDASQCLGAEAWLTYHVCQNFLLRAWVISDSSRRSSE
jgi:hypothetical protein